MGSPNPDLEPTTSDNPSSPPPPPSTFHGRLQLTDFMYQPGDTPALRRSPRHASAAVPTRSTSSSPVKRARSRSPASPKKKKKKKRASSGYAPPSTYAHLPLLPDALLPDLLVLFVGLNPGLQTARTGHAYAHPTNTFWRLLHASGATPELCAAEDDALLPARFRLGLTNIVGRPSRNGAELSRREMDDGVAVLEAKIREYRPEAVCLVGKGIWESVWRVRHGGRAVGERFRYGWQEEEENMGVVEGEWAGARVFVASSTSGLAATLSPAQKLEIWSELGAWVKMRRAEREVAAEREAAASV
ncbi:DNA glycosylase, G/T mismatch [Cordyceps fumosorosea ARSEF 2679]|uniref:DNA glycosylase, G/T mismatch n=1 Tax=Cordyceps fumosorosea (strain ARSEF 2679) TaxID=1081104 RepID=A0A167UH41_CORFA|nr:DNA glycosylase, G/T mismatch [Cordyceps fumosorosea ARSEF 2679]OAA61573.1 DNA glycosylase, G/T mismatch [Cordyceps fumosorosea ARSEF 2679]